MATRFAWLLFLANVLVSDSQNTFPSSPSALRSDILGGSSRSRRNAKNQDDGSQHWTYGHYQQLINSYAQFGHETQVAGDGTSLQPQTGLSYADHQRQAVSGASAGSSQNKMAAGFPHLGQGFTASGNFDMSNAQAYGGYQYPPASYTGQAVPRHGYGVGGLPKSQATSHVRSDDGQISATSSSLGKLGHSQSQTQVDGGAMRGGSFQAKAASDTNQGSVQSRVHGRDGTGFSTGVAALHGMSESRTEARVDDSRSIHIPPQGGYASSVHRSLLNQGLAEAQTSGGSDRGHANSKSFGPGMSASEANVGLGQTFPAPYGHSAYSTAEGGVLQGKTDTRVRGGNYQGYSSNAKSSYGQHINFGTVPQQPDVRGVSSPVSPSQATEDRKIKQFFSQLGPVVTQPESNQRGVQHFYPVDPNQPTLWRNTVPLPDSKSEDVIIPGSYQLPAAPQVPGFRTTLVSSDEQSPQAIPLPAANYPEVHPSSMSYIQKLRSGLKSSAVRPVPDTQVPVNVPTQPVSFSGISDHNVPVPQPQEPVFYGKYPYQYQPPTDLGSFPQNVPIPSVAPTPGMATNYPRKRCFNGKRCYKKYFNSNSKPCIYRPVSCVYINGGGNKRIKQCDMVPIRC